VCAQAFINVCYINGLKYEKRRAFKCLFSPECYFALERLQEKSHVGVKYDKERPIIKQGRPTIPFPNLRIKIQYYVGYFQQTGTQLSCVCDCTQRETTLLAVCSVFGLKMRDVKNFIRFKNAPDYSEADITPAMALIIS
jgi:hypothetical protein